MKGRAADTADLVALRASDHAKLENVDMDASDAGHVERSMACLVQLA